MNLDKLELIKIIESKKDNLGGLSGFLKRRPELLQILNNELFNLSLEYLNSLTLMEKCWHMIHSKDEQLCICSKKLKWNGLNYGYKKTCSNKKCIIETTKKTNLEKHGYENPFQSSELKKQGMLKKYGVDNPTKSIIIQQRRKDKELATTGLTHSSKRADVKAKMSNTQKRISKETDILQKRALTISNFTEEEKKKIIEKRQNTLIEKTGYNSTFYNPEVQNKIKETKLQRYGVEHHFMNTDIQQKRADSYRNNRVLELSSKLESLNAVYVKHTENLEYTIKCTKCLHESTLSYCLLRTRILAKIDLCFSCSNSSNSSISEQEIANFIMNNYIGYIIRNSFQIIKKASIDIYLPDLNLAFEFNGVYWHNELYKDEKYHLQKSEKCAELGITLIHIWEDDWLYKKDIVKSRILNLLQKSSRKIYARQCEIVNLSSSELKEFLEINHLQGNLNSKIKIGLKYQNELVSVMSFGAMRGSLGSKNKSNLDFEMYRFCTKINCNVIGAAGKMFNYFIKNHNVNRVVTMFDRSWGKSKVYEKIGFNFSHNSSINYWYVDQGIRKHRYNYRKDVLVKQGYDESLTEKQIMLDRKIYRIYDLGNEVWIYSKS